MKKTLLSCTLVLFIVCVIACGKDASNPSNPQQEATVTQASTTQQEESLPTAEPTPTKEPENVVITEYPEIMFVGDTAEINASGAENIVWTSSDSSIAVIDESGNVNAKAAGTVTITAASANDSQINAEITITIGDHVQTVSLDQIAASLLTGSDKDTVSLNAHVLPETAFNQVVHYSSSDESVATVDQEGVVHAVAPGDAVITVTADDDACQETAFCVITVKRGVSEINLSQNEAELYLQDKLTIQAEILPEDAEDKTFVWASSDEAVATVSQDGAVTPVSAGTAVITCSALDGSETEGKCEVNVVIGIQSIILEQKNATVLVGASKELSQVQLNYSVTPDNSSFQKVQWISSDETIATVDENGTVSGVSAGKVTVTAVTTDQRAADRVKATCSITVGNAITQIAFTDIDERIQKGTSKKITAKITPDNAFNSKIEWTSSNEDVIKVDASGNIRAVGVGSATVTATATDGSKVSSSKKFTVYQPVTQLTAKEKGTTVIFGGQEKTFHVEVGPNDATDKKVVWSSSNTSVARVNNNGTVTGSNAGTAIITATANDGSNKKCTFNIVVEPMVPLTIDSIGFGIYNGNLLGITVKNNCSKTTIKNFDFDIKMYAYDNTLLSSSGSYSIGKDETMSPNAKKTIKRNVSGTSWTQTVVITITGVKLADGSFYSIPVSAQETWSFTRK